MIRLPAPVLLAAAALSAGACTAAPSPAVHARLAAGYSMAEDGHAVLILVDGQLAAESYADGWSRTTPHRIASGTKSFMGPLAAAAVMDGFLDLDERACDTLTEWRDDRRKSRITVRQLLDFTSGLDPIVARNRDEVAAADLWLKALEMEAIEEPGALWMYGGTHLAAFGELMRRKLLVQGTTFDEYFDVRLLLPLNIEIPSWTRDGGGNRLLSSGVEITARDWAKFGEFIRAGGRTPGGRQLVDPNALAQCFWSSNAHGGYGLTWWLEIFEKNRLRLPMDFRMAAGAGKQQLYVLPSRGIPAVRQGESPGFSNAEFLSRLLDGRPLPR